MEVCFLFIFSSFVKPFFKANLSHSLSIIIDLNGQFGVFMHGNRIVGRNESTRYKLIAGWIDREDNRANFGYISYRQSGNIFSFFYFSCTKCANCELFSIILTLLYLIFFCSGFGAPGRFRYSSAQSLERARFFFFFFLDSLVVFFFFFLICMSNFFFFF